MSPAVELLKAEGSQSWAHWKAKLTAKGRVTNLIYEASIAPLLLYGAAPRRLQLLHCMTNWDPPLPLLVFLAFSIPVLSLSALAVVRASLCSPTASTQRCSWETCVWTGSCRAAAGGFVSGTSRPKIGREGKKKKKEHRFLLGFAVGTEVPSCLFLPCVSVCLCWIWLRLTEKL